METNKITLFVFLSIFLPLNAQDFTIPDQINESVELIIEELPDEQKNAEGFDVLYNYFLNLSIQPIDLNLANAEKLKTLLVLSDFQIYSFLQYRKEYGPFLSLFELEFIPGFDQQDIQTLEPFVTLEGGLSREEINKSVKHELILRTQQKLPLDSDEQAGDKNKAYVRYKAQKPGRYQAGLLMEKDPGEQYLYKEMPEIFDFTSVHIALFNRGRLKTFVLGDYRMGFGQGLVMWQGFSKGKAMHIQSTLPSLTGIKPYTSVNENNFSRGIAATFDIFKTDISVFYSNKAIDGNVTIFDSIRNKPLEFSSFQTTGLHNTPGLKEDRNSINEQMAGLHIKKKFNFIEMGLTGIQHTYNAFYKKTDKPYNELSFSGNTYTAISFDYGLHYRGFKAYGEEAWSLNQGWAIFNHVEFTIIPEIKTFLSHRNYSEGYFSQYAQGFGESGSVANENGVFMGSSIFFQNGLSIIVYTDIFSFPWLRYQSDAPVLGYENYVQANQSIGKRFKMRIKYRNKTRFENQTSPMDKSRSLFPYYSRNLQLQCHFQITDQFALRQRIDYKNYQQNKGNSNGWMILQDLNYNHPENKVGGYLRAGYFRTDDYNSRIYTYENDLAYVFSIPAYAYQGFRYYMVGKYKTDRRLSLYFKAGYTQYLKNISTKKSDAPEPVLPKNNAELKLQAIIHF